MLIPLTKLVRDGSTEAPQERAIAINPEYIKRVEEKDDLAAYAGPACTVWVEDEERPLIVAGTVHDVLLATRGFDALTKLMLKG
jgi:hypothetical protein